MSAFQPPPTPPPNAARASGEDDDGVPTKRRPRWLILVVAVVVLGAALAGVFAWLGRSEGSKGWDKRIASIASDVERLRGLRYDHPVPVDFLTDKEFRKRVTVERSELSKQEKRDLARAQGELRALGLIKGDVDLLAAVNKLGAEDILAYYDPVKKRVSVRGKQLDIATRVTVAHELTHVLQDQHFDLEHLRKQAEAGNAGEPLTALIEGDAVRTENRYVETLSQKDQEAYNAAQDRQANSPDQVSLKDVPEVVGVLQAAPYTFGPSLIEVIVADGGERAVNAAFRRPPKTDKDFFDPVSYVAKEKAKKVAVPSLGPDEQRDGKPDTFGVFGLYLTLASRLDPATALTAADGWTGDSEVTFKRAATYCLRVVFTGRAPRDPGAIADGLRAWAAAGPAGAAVVEATGDLVTFTACDPGNAAPAPKSVGDAMRLAVDRDDLLAGLVRSGAPPATAACVSDRIVRDPALLEKLASLDQSGQTPDAPTLAAIRAAAASCAPSGG